MTQKISEPCTCVQSVFRVYFVNHDYYSQNEATDLKSAKAIAQAAGFEARIDCFQNGKSNSVAGWDPIMGWKYF